MPTLLARRNGPAPMATDDETYAMLQADPEMKMFPQISTSASVTSSQTVLTAAGDNAAQNAVVLVENDAESSSWINRRWRPLMAWVYMAICIADFILYPVLWSLLQAHYNGQVPNQYQPMSLQGGGLIHLAFGAILGIAAYGRSKEKIAGVVT